MQIFEANPVDKWIAVLIGLSADWEREDSCRGYRTNGHENIESNRVFIAAEDGIVCGYLFGHAEQSARATAVMPEGATFFELEELYVVPERRGQGVGRELFEYVEAKLKADGISHILLSTATKDHRRILHFYIDELGMEFWSARLFKKI